MSSVIVQPDIIVVVQVGQQGPKGATGFPAWTTATRPVAPALGDAGFNTTDQHGLADAVRDMDIRQQAVNYELGPG
jgi:hypothetical protein